MKTIITLALTLIVASATTSLAQTHTSTPRRVVRSARQTAPAADTSATNASKSAGSASGSVSVGGGTVGGSVSVGMDMEKLQGFYQVGGVGYAGVSYPGAMQQSIDRFRAISGASNYTGAIEWGVYVPMGNRMLVGDMNTAAIDYFNDGSFTATMTQLSSSASALYFATGTIGNGFFVRGDLGLSYLAASNSEGFNAKSELGVGALAGVGYAVPVLGGTRGTINASYSIRGIESEPIGTLAFTVGVMF